ncbi:hypothetical protein [Ureibacillus thermophilus]|uniref:Uncharacterized protein n=1 Tax=Ureibacillus thermophilus TaxID=367743 RepID=A0A4P6USG5_9BACL|nr:hypothetical protein [Ureibacillus thermophilus]QBK26259.1 hypothetical protein DKZ56_10520 [Ureibacillus thermophilus]
MYREITVDRSLLYIEQYHIDTFNELAKKYSQFNYLVKEGALNLIDAWIIAFNIWLLLLPDKYHIIHSAGKTLFYSSNFVILTALEENIHINQLKARENRPELLYYIISLQLATGINRWILHVMLKHDLTDMIERNKNRVYFDAHLGTKEEIQIFLENQSRFVKAAVKELNSTNSFDKMIRRSINESHNVYNDYQNKSKEPSTY